MNLAVIPARGGSKRIPRKNVRDFNGKPMLAWSIEAAIGAQCFDRVIVSTDDAEIAEVAQSFGAEVPFERPSLLSDDFATTAPVMRHAVNWAISIEPNIQFACCLYPTAPLMRPSDLRVGLEKIKGSKWDYVFSATSFPFSIQRAIQVSEVGAVSLREPEHEVTRSQDLPEMYHDAGQFYWGTVSAWLSEFKVFSPSSTIVNVERYRVQDIDTPEDWVYAEKMAKVLDLNKSSTPSN